MRVTADGVAARSELPDAVRVEETGRSDPGGGDEEVTAQPTTLECGSGLKRARAAIVEGQGDLGAAVEQPLTHVGPYERV